MKIHLLSGFLGSGKTTAIQQATSILVNQGNRVGVITNDQGIKLVDGNFFKSLNIPSRQVVNGCFCCNYNELDDNIESLIKDIQPEIIFAESVGSCTDIVATVLRPLLHLRPSTDVTISTFADARLLYMLLSGTPTSFDESVTYIYYKQLEDAGIIVVNKIDLLNARDLEDLKKIMKNIYAHKTLIFQNSLDPVSLNQWLTALKKSASSDKLPSLDIDYDTYGAGEAKLAWFDQELEIFNSTSPASLDAMSLINLVYNKIRLSGYPIGHLKFLLNDNLKISFTSSTKNPVTPDISRYSSSSAKILINARVQTLPELLSKLVSETIAEISVQGGCTIAVTSVSSFQPGYPRPTHRILAGTD